MNKIKLCCFTVNSTHAYIISNNFINNEFNDKSFYTEWLNEKITHDYNNETFVFVVNGKQEFVDKVNEYLDINEAIGYVINCYDIFDIKKDTASIISSHDYYINTSGVVKKETLNL